ncbi:ComEC/Rec2 family competence protein [Trueperella pecoris]|uniref:ComEC/Rec2 family competence protein n=1 Tax=Trueperella pecoris TaxID=2733571 RepID=A0A7M1QRN6_9ACTO|nr:ComEC/Rec2 family competence protein [Trueperella pecoris]QOR44822.1 ComEC/Rec2 family competence protein [Trueperella pecoris]
MSREDYRLLLPAGLVWVVAIIGPLDYLALGLMALLVTAMGLMHENWLATIVGVALVGASIAGGMHFLVRDSDIVMRSGGAVVEAVGVVESYPKEKDGAFTAKATISSVTASGRTHSSSAQVLIRWEGERLERGMSFHGRGKLESLPEDFVAFAKLNLTHIRHDSGGNAARIHSALRGAIADRPWHAQLIPGVVIGDDTGLPEQTIALMRTLNLSHLTAVSGAHISMVLALVLFGVGRRQSVVAGVVSLFALVALVELVGQEASVLRAGYMGILLCLAIALRRPSSALPLLNATVLAVSLLDIDLARSLGFQLSVLATAAIIIFSYPLQQRLATHMPRVLADLLAISLVAAVATGPITLTIQDEASVWAVLANALVAPVVTPLTIGGMSAALLLPIIPWLAIPILRACELCTWWMVTVSKTLGALPGSGLPASVVFVFNFLILLALAVTLTMGGVRLLLASMGVAATSVWLSTFMPTYSPADWEAIQCDVGQGSAFLARDDRTTVLVDVGPENGNISGCLRAAGVNKLDLVVLSHFDADHVRGLAEVIENVQVDMVWHSPNLAPDYNSRWALALLKDRRIEHAAVRYGQSLGRLATVVGPRSVIGAQDSSNTDSLVVVLQTASHRILVLADAPYERQVTLVSEVEGVDVVVAGHHGARDQSPELARKIRPAISVFSVGDNDYGHPTREALDIWRAPILARTDQCGHIAITAGEVVAGCRSDVE